MHKYPATSSIRTTGLCVDVEICVLYAIRRKYTYTYTYITGREVENMYISYLRAV